MAGWKMGFGVVLGVGVGVLVWVWPVKFGLAGEGETIEAMFRNSESPTMGRIVTLPGPTPAAGPDLGFLSVYWHIPQLDQWAKAEGSDGVIELSREEYEQIRGNLDVVPNVYYFTLSQLKTIPQKFVAFDPRYGMGSYRITNFKDQVWSKEERRFKERYMMLFEEMDIHVGAVNDASGPKVEFSAIYGGNAKFNIVASEMPAMMGGKNELVRCQHDFIRGIFAADREGYYAMKMKSETTSISKTKAVKDTMVKDVLVLVEIHPKG